MLPTGDLHQALLEAGFSISHDELDAETFGPSTRAAVLAFQRERGLVVDGIAGPKTWVALRTPRLDGFTDRGFRVDLSACRASVLEAVRAAAGEVGQIEQPTGSNRGPRIDRYTDPHFGAPWCAYFVSWAYARGGASTPRIGSAWGWQEWAARKGRLVTAAALEPGDMAIIRRAGRRGHVAMVVASLGGGRIATVGGNESNAVRGRVRDVGAFSDYARPVV
jgi:hypothetical protein